MNIPKVRLYTLDEVIAQTHWMDPKDTGGTFEQYTACNLRINKGWASLPHGLSASPHVEGVNCPTCLECVALCVEEALQ